MEIQYGVYINNSIEIVITSKYSIAYRINTAKNKMESYLMTTENFECVGICITDMPINDCGFTDFTYYSDSTDKVAFALGIQENDTFASDMKLRELLGKRLLTFSTSGDQNVFSFFDGVDYSTYQNEDLSGDSFKPIDTEADESNVDNCLQRWHIGAKEVALSMNGNRYVVGVEINTLNHMYIFRITTNFIYCRAARYFACKKGVIFNQNFRQNFHMKNGMYEGNTSAYNDNSIALKNLDYDDKLFGDACVFGGVNIYWSVSLIEKDTITLNGCDGDIYIWRKPKTSP